jgi:hypothetical protein
MMLFSLEFSESFGKVFNFSEMQGDHGPTGGGFPEMSTVFKKRK